MGTSEVLNYLDKDKNGKEHLKPLAKGDVIKEMVKLHKNCVWWEPAVNNCEIVLATVRYGSQNIKVLKCVVKTEMCFWSVFVVCYNTFAYVYFMQCEVQ